MNTKRGLCILAQKTVFFKLSSLSNLDHIFGPENSSQGEHRSPRGVKYFQGTRAP